MLAGAAMFDPALRASVRVLWTGASDACEFQVSYSIRRPRHVGGGSATGGGAEQIDDTLSGECLNVARAEDGEDAGFKCVRHRLTASAICCTVEASSPNAARKTSRTRRRQGNAGSCSTDGDNHAAS